MKKSEWLAGVETSSNYMDIYIFPYEKISKGDRVVIYGAGHVGRRYVEQILSNDYCELVCVVDKQSGNLRSDFVRLESPSILESCTFDYVVIAIKEWKTAEEIRKTLVDKYAVLPERIIWKASLRYSHTPSKCIWNRLPDHSASADEVLISAFIGAGFGDAIISKKILEALYEVAGANCRIDLYVHDVTYVFVQGLFRNHSCVKNIYRDSAYRFSCYYQSYDLSIIPNYILSIKYCDFKDLQRKNPIFAECILRLKTCLDEAGLSNAHKINNAVLFARAKKLGCNAYTVHSYDGILPIKDTHVDIPLLKEREKDYKDFSFMEDKTYFITVNYGWGENHHEAGYVPCKIWPFEYYVKLIKLIKKERPMIKIVQVGRGGAPPIPGVDVFLCDLDIEILKYLLKDSLLHIDSEGGMVHLATQLGTKCLVAFGPTPVHFFGYESNINVLSNTCSNCCFLVDDFTECLRKMKRPECMYSIRPEMMYEKFDEYLKSIGEI